MPQHPISVGRGRPCHGWGLARACRTGGRSRRSRSPGSLLLLAGLLGLPGRLCGQDPVHSPPFISGLRPGADGTLAILFEDPGQEGSLYWLDSSSNPAPGNWTAVDRASFLELGPGRFAAVTVMEAGAPACFYRVVRQPPCASDETLFINEVMTDNESAFQDADGDCPDWVEIRNAGLESMQLRGYCLSDDPGEPGKWRFPPFSLDAGACLLIFASGKDRSAEGAPFHTSFRLRTGQETILLACPDGTVIDRIEPGPLPADQSLGRGPDEAGRWYVFPSAHVTPGEPNRAPAFAGAEPFLEAPGFSLASGFYSQPLLLALTPPSAGGSIRYTLDGSDPSEFSPAYARPIALQTATVVRARAFDARGFSSRVKTRTYFIGASHALPVLSLAASPGNFGFRDGYLYGLGSQMFDSHGNINAAFPFYGSNAWKGREIETNVEFFEPGGAGGFNIAAGLQIFGGWGSRGYPQKSFAIFARRQYGFGKISHRVFPDLDIDEFENLVLRNSGNDNQSTHQTVPRPPITAFSPPKSYGSYFVNGSYTLLRDAMMQSLGRDIGLDTQGYRPAVLYVNGEYWGLFNIREKADEHFVASHHGLPDENIDLIEGYGTPVTGSAVYYNQMRDYIESHDLRNAQDYALVRERYLEIDNFIDYHLAVIYFQNFDIGNIKCWRPRREDGRFRWILYDQDYGFDLWKPEVYLPAMARDYADYDNMFDFYTNSVGTSTGWPNAGGRTLLLRRLLVNREFRRQFINRCADLLNSAFREERVAARIEAMAAVIRPEIARHLSRWGWPSLVARGYGTPHKAEDEPFSIEDWEENIRGLIAYAHARPGKLRQDLIDHFGLQDGTANVRVDVSPPGAGQVQIHSLVLGQFPWTGTYFVDLPPQIEARPLPGFRFLSWKVNGQTIASGPDLASELRPAETLELTALFEPG